MSVVTHIDTGGPHLIPPGHAAHNLLGKNTYVDGRIICSGRIDPIPGTTFAGIWGGATLPEYRGRGIYRALTAARVRSAMARGVRWIHSDSTADSRPIFERAGLVKVTETVPWVWRRTKR